MHLKLNCLQTLTRSLRFEGSLCLLSSKCLHLKATRSFQIRSINTIIVIIVINKKKQRKCRRWTYLRTCQWMRWSPLTFSGTPPKPLLKSLANLNLLVTLLIFFQFSFSSFFFLIFRYKNVQNLYCHIATSVLTRAYKLFDIMLQLAAIWR